VQKCNACDISLTYHRERQRATCHGCDAEFRPPEHCPDCGATSLHYGGIGTERLEREVKSAFPDRVVRRMDSDSMRSHGSHEKVLEAFKAGQVDILLGTQMIAKGLDFPEVTLVGVVNADTALHLPDFRASERTFQLVAQVAGRTGRGDRPGRVLVQTFCPEDPAIRYAAAHDYAGFVGEELPRRRAHDLPPFSRLVRLIARGVVPQETQEFMGNLADALRAASPGTVQFRGPSPAPVSKIRNLFRFHLQMKAATSGPLHELLKSVLPAHEPPHGVELAVDVDPISML
jgi:primosomal protein N' (replication factor Y)